MKLIALALATFVAATHVSAQPVRPNEADPSELAKQVIAAYEKGDVKQSLALATKFIEAAPKNPQSWSLRGRIHSAQRQHELAAADLAEIPKLTPKSASAWQQSGVEYFRAALLPCGGGLRG